MDDMHDAKLVKISKRSTLYNRFIRSNIKDVFDRMKLVGLSVGPRGLALLIHKIAATTSNEEFQQQQLK